MKYIVPESRLSQIIEKYLTDKYSTIKRHDFIRGVEGNKIVTHCWTISGEQVLDEFITTYIKDGKHLKMKILVLNRDDYYDMIRLFNLTEEELSGNILKWAKKHLGYEYLDVYVG